MIDQSDELIVLFDEQGSPTFRDDREREYFLGVAVSYLKSNESQIFIDCDKDFGLSKNKVLKNTVISNTRAKNIAQKFSSLPIQLTVASMKLGDTNLQRAVSLYRDFGNILRTRHRRIRNRPIAQILYPQIFNHAVFSAVSNFIYQNPYVKIVNIFIDNWSFSPNDTVIALDYNKKVFQKVIKIVLEKLEINTEVRINDYTILDANTPKKRFIDSIASVASRNYLNIDDPKYFHDVFDIMTSNKTMKHEIIDITDTIILFLKDFMDRTARGKYSEGYSL